MHFQKFFDEKLNEIFCTLRHYDPTVVAIMIWKSQERCTYEIKSYDTDTAKYDREFNSLDELQTFVHDGIQAKSILYRKF